MLSERFSAAPFPWCFRAIERNFRGGMCNVGQWEEMLIATNIFRFILAHSGPGAAPNYRSLHPEKNVFHFVVKSETARVLLVSVSSSMMRMRRRNAPASMLSQSSVSSPDAEWSFIKASLISNYCQSFDVVHDVDDATSTFFALVCVRVGVSVIDRLALNV